MSLKFLGNLFERERMRVSEKWGRGGIAEKVLIIAETKVEQKAFRYIVIRCL